ncbi:hypothetical protein SDC9_115605 [bioreactor metagenome]|uniref:Uncharacterized protein n=1 Tax=bioreactor metagenome TaxID=1076179 RepID=A0A645BVP3_9ZZZZ
MRAAGVFRQELTQFQGDLAPQLRCGGFRIGDHEKVVNVAAVLKNV